MKTSKIFIEAKKHLWDGERNDHGVTYICTSIDQVRGGLSALQRYKAKQVISDRLWPHGTAYQWLISAVGEASVSAAGPIARQKWRHAWLDQLIAEFKAKGD
jgi:hypothetical protein